jgi:hypothetical protein
MCAALGALLALGAVACAASPEQQARAVASLDQMLRSGAITLDQYQALMAALTGGDWLDSTLQIVLPIVGAWLGVPWVASIARGRVGNRKGLAEALAHISPQQMQGARVTAAADKAADATPVAPIKTPASIPVTPG